MMFSRRRRHNQLPIELLSPLLLLKQESCGDPRAQAGAAAHEMIRERRTVISGEDRQN